MINLKDWKIPDDKALAEKRLELVRVTIEGLRGEWAEISKNVGFTKEKKVKRRELDLKLMKYRAYEVQLVRRLAKWG